MSKYRQTFAEAYNSIYESAAAKEIDRKNTRKDSMDYKMLKKAVDLLKSKKYSELKTFLKKSDTSPREYVMFTILMKEPMKKINAMYKESNRPHRYLKTKPGSLEEAVLKSRGLIK